MKQKTQSGSAHIVIVVILVLALLSALGFIFWQNFIHNKSSSPSEVVQITTEDNIKPMVISDKTFTSAKNIFTFQYPGNWTTAELVDASYPDFPIHTVTVKDSNKKVVATLQTGAQLGGICDPSQEMAYTTLDASLTDIKGSKPVFFGLSAVINPNGGYDVHYGLTDHFNKIEEGTICPNTFYYVFGSGSNQLGGVGFGNDIVKTVQYRTLQEVKDFIASDEYKAVKKMASSLKY